MRCTSQWDTAFVWNKIGDWCIMEAAYRQIRTGFCCYHAYAWIENTLIHLPSCNCKLYHHLPRGTGHRWRAWKCCRVSRWLSAQRSFLLEPKRNKGQALFMDGVTAEGFSFWQAVIPTGCISDLVEAGPSCSFGFLVQLLPSSPSVYFFADRTTVALPVLSIIFL